MTISAYKLNTEGDAYYTFSTRLVLQACEKTCYQRNVIEQCHCSDAYFPSSNASAFNHVIVPVCSSSNITQGTFVRNEANEFLKIVNSAQCRTHITFAPVRGCTRTDAHVVCARTCADVPAAVVRSNQAQCQLCA